MTLSFVPSQATILTLSFLFLSSSVIQAFVRVTVSKSDALNILSSAVGWIYFVAWSVSFYPQVQFIKLAKFSGPGFHLGICQMNWTLNGVTVTLSYTVCNLIPNLIFKKEVNRQTSRSRSNCECADRKVSAI